MAPKAMKTAKAKAMKVAMKKAMKNAMKGDTLERKADSFGSTSMQFAVGDTLEHFRTGRRGVLRYLGENERCFIQFEDGKEEWRWVTAFVKV